MRLLFEQGFAQGGAPAALQKDAAETRLRTGQFNRSSGLEKSIEHPPPAEDEHSSNIPTMIIRNFGVRQSK